MFSILLKINYSDVYIEWYKRIFAIYCLKQGILMFSELYICFHDGRHETYISATCNCLRKDTLKSYIKLHPSCIN